MKIIIDIPEERYNRIDYIDNLSLKEIVKNGTPLPKGHGRIVDLEEVDRSISANTTIELYQNEWDELYKAINAVPTVIEADE